MFLRILAAANNGPGANLWSIEKHRRRHGLMSLSIVQKGHQLFIYLNSAKAFIVVTLTRFADDNRMVRHDRTACDERAGLGKLSAATLRRSGHSRGRHQTVIWVSENHVPTTSFLVIGEGTATSFRRFVSPLEGPMTYA